MTAQEEAAFRPISIAAVSYHSSLEGEMLHFYSMFKIESRQFKEQLM